MLVILEDLPANSFWKLLICLLFAMTCKENISLLVVGIGVWLYLQHRRRIGLLLCSLGFSWFCLVGGILIPYFGGENASLTRHAVKYGLPNGSLLDFHYLQLVISQLLRQIFSMTLDFR